MRPIRSLPGSQQGVVLLIALIVLVAMSLAGVALIRSVDTTVVVAGNLAFSQSAVQAGDNGVAAAAKWLESKNTGDLLSTSDETNGYFSAAPATEPNWHDKSNWDGASTALNSGNPDSSGNIVRYVIHRMCSAPDSAWNSETNKCGTFPTRSASEGGSQTTTAAPYEGPPMLFYRITTRVDGPRNTVNVIQSTVVLTVPG
jgi:type IV pilus assembly protein PilX